MTNLSSSSRKINSLLDKSRKSKEVFLKLKEDTLKINEMLTDESAVLASKISDLQILNETINKEVKVNDKVIANVTKIVG